MQRGTRIVIAIMLSVIVGMAVLYYVFLPIWVKQKLQNLTGSKKDEISLQVKHIHSTFWPIGIVLKNINIQKSEPAQSTDNHISIARIRIQGFRWLALLFQKKYILDKINVDEILGVWTLPSTSDSTEVFTLPFDALCRKFEIRDLNLRLKQRDSNQETTLENAYLVISNFSLQKDSILTSNAFEIHELTLPFIQHVSADSLYTYRAHQLDYSDKSLSLKMDSLLMLPNYANYIFAQRHEFQTDRIHVELKGLSVAQCNLDLMLSDGDLYASSISIDSFLVDIFRDRRLPFLHKERPLYQDLLQAYPGKLSIDSITAHQGTISFSEHDENAPEAGKVWFTEVSATLSHLYNDSTLNMKNDTLIVTAKALAMGKGEISFTSRGYLFDSQNTFDFSGRMENVSAAAFNPMLRPNAGIMAKDGYVKGLYFNFIADHVLAKGDLLFRYNDLLLYATDKETGLKKGLKNRLLTTALDRKILDANPMPNDSLRHGQIHYERDPEKMYFAYIFKSIFSGIKTSVEK
ncbi:MAG: hypothetical protein SH808_01290 [Saprospiraceae bacterium]|nr:hypothetical protein [Saprospiraceae bacterium]